jgi:hypothetical protein
MASGNGASRSPTPREIRRAFGDRALHTLDQQTRAISAVGVSTTAHEARIAVLERSVSDAAAASVADLGTITALVAAVGELQGRIAALEAHALQFGLWSVWRRLQWLIGGR